MMPHYAIGHYPRTGCVPLVPPQGRYECPHSFMLAFADQVAGQTSTKKMPKQTYRKGIPTPGITGEAVGNQAGQIDLAQGA